MLGSNKLFQILVPSIVRYSISQEESVCSDELNWLIRMTAMARIKMKGPYVKYLVTDA